MNALGVYLEPKSVDQSHSEAKLHPQVTTKYSRALWRTPEKLGTVRKLCRAEDVFSRRHRNG
jgi:hypothetical protein